MVTHDNHLIVTRTHVHSDGLWLTHTLTDAPARTHTLTEACVCVRTHTHTHTQEEEKRSELDCLPLALSTLSFETGSLSVVP